jgi:two-component system, NtrC family, nitrogen regulation sensor histidine kinase NtrY
MIYKRFTFLIVVRIVLLLTNVTVISLIFGDKRLFFNQVILAMLLVVQVLELIRFVNHTNRELAKFFYAIRHSDFSITFKQSILSKSFRELQESMSGIIQAYKQVKIEKEAQFHFLQMLVNQLHIGIIALEKDDSISLINPHAESMLGIPGLKNWKIVQVRNPAFAKEIGHLGANGKKLVEMRSPSETHFLSVDVRTLLILDKPLKLITLQDINSEIEQKEIEAWHKLIRILTHEIMNSVTPISSLTETMQGFLKDQSGNEKQLHELKQETISDISFSLNTIQKRTDGLLHFVDNYRKLTKVPKPHPEKVNIRSFLDAVRNLMSHELTRQNIRVSISVEENLEIDLDPALLEQVLINLVTNSIHALEHTADPHIALRAYHKDRQAVIEVTDNGKGIPAKELGEIFIPFFSTKKNGSGIGLSLSKQIIGLHGGAIRVQSEAGARTSFFLQFKIQ